MSNSTDLVVREKEAKELVALKVKQIEVLTGDKAKASAYGSALVSLASNRNLVKCSVESILDVGFQIVQAGLNPNPLFNEAYAVPYDVKKDGRVVMTVAQLQVGVKGYVTLAYRGGWIVKTRIIYKCDEFSFDYSGFDEDIMHKPNLEKQENTNPAWVFKNIVGVVVMAKDSIGNIFKQFVPNSKIEQIRMKSPNQNDKNKYTYIWEQWSEEMVQAKAAKYVLKRLPISDDVLNMIVQDEASERGYIDVKPKSSKKVEDINKI